MNLYEYIKQEYKNVALLFKKFKESSSDEDKKEITKSICEELSIHLDSEKEIFYKSLMQYHETRELITHVAEHDDLEKIISLLKNNLMAHNILESEVLNLKKNVGHYNIRNEEEDIHLATSEISLANKLEIIK